ncbi:MAG: enoyl-CoA hydratase/isomerase family protein [Paraburkholderia sp.]|uniref:enoyl-CoA hydratase/isomerase family protein n=1 Tax=Paraburkholderia sp. TaxID=1926495 RepID=UPI003C541EE5
MSALQSVALDAGVEAEREILFRVVNRVAIITLNRPPALNALSHAMVRELAVLVEHCRTEDGIVAIVLNGAGAKGFCAGGDVRDLHRLASAKDLDWQQFFIDEYRLDYALHTFPKPVVALLDGVTMGGGMGLGQGARLRVVTERTKMAMPETRIGLIPDVGASYFLAKMPVETELYVGLTGTTLTGPDAVLCRLADVCVPSEWLKTFEERLQLTPSPRLNPAFPDVLMRSLQAIFEPPGNVMAHAPLGPLTQVIKRYFNPRFDLDRIVGTLKHDADANVLHEIKQWIQTTLEVLKIHSPTMLHVAREAMLRGRRSTLADCFRMELGIVTRAVEDGDFLEGVRAHLVDRDRKPRWALAHIHEVRQERVQHFLSSPWRSTDHPLRDIECVRP